MAVRETVQIGDTRLEAKNVEVTDVRDKKVIQVIEDLIDTMRENQLIGMAAPQIGENYQIFVTEPRKTVFRSGVGDKLRVYLNPRIVKSSDKKVIAYEGCGSVMMAGKFGPVERSKYVTVEAIDETGNRFRLTADGILGRVIQHEVDHLNGIEFIDKVDKQQLVDRKLYIEKVRNSPQQLKAAEITGCEVQFI